MPRSKELVAVSSVNSNGHIETYNHDEIATTSGFHQDEQISNYGSVELPEASYSENLETDLMSKRMKLVKTLSMSLIYLGMGFWAGVVSPTTIDMSELYGISLEGFVRASSAKSIGLLTGCFTGAFVADKFRPKADLGLFVCNFIGGIAFFIIPWSPNVASMAIMFFINGICHGTLNVVCSTINLAMWGTAAPAPIHGLQMCFALGITLAPPIAVPFLSNGYKENVTSTELLDLSEYGNQLNSNHTNNSYTGHVKMAYGIFGLWSVGVAIVFIIMFLKGTPYSSTTNSQEKLKFKDFVNPARIAGGRLKYGIYFLISLFLLYVFLIGRSRGMSMYLFVIAHEDVLQMSKPVAALLVTCYNMFQALGRGLAALISHWLPVKPFLFIQLIIAAFIQLLLFFYGLESNLSLWILSAILGIVSGPTYPSLMTWADRYIEASGVVIAVIDIGIGLGEFIALWFYGHMYEVSNSVGVFALSLVYGVILLLTLIPLQIVAAIHGDRHKNKGTNTEHLPQTQIQDFRLPDDDEYSALIAD